MSLIELKNYKTPNGMNYGLLFEDKMCMNIVKSTTVKPRKKNEKKVSGMIGSMGQESKVGGIKQFEKKFKL